MLVGLLVSRWRLATSLVDRSTGRAVSGRRHMQGHWVGTTRPIIQPAYPNVTSHSHLRVTSQSQVGVTGHSHLTEASQSRLPAIAGAGRH